MQIRIPLHKVDQLRDLISVVIQRHKITLKEFQSLVGKLSFFTKAIRSSRAFLRRCFDAMIGIKKLFHKLRIKAAIRLDLSTWLTFLDSFNGVAYIPSDTWFHSDILELHMYIPTVQVLWSTAVHVFLGKNGHFFHGQNLGVWKKS